MSKLRDATNEMVGTVMAGIIGWAFSMAMLAGAFLVGYWVAPYLNGAAHRDAFGILSAMVFVWIYERREAEARWNRLHDAIGRINAPRDW
jgi:hypothetical protein